ncbi:MAG TPA: sodium-translocating pyrophosphatase [Candidatus Azoamicus sp.]
MLINESIIILSIIISSIIALIFIKEIMSFPQGTEEMIKISNIIQSCSKTYLKRQYKTILYASIIISILMIIFLNYYYFLGFIIGAFFSGIAGYLGMSVSVKANVRTTNAVKIHGLKEGLNIAFKSGCITGLFVINLSVLAIFLFYYFLTFIGLDVKTILNSLLSLGFGASLISVFARLGGGIFTKAADIGADLVGKLEIGIPEDDPRNPAVIADNVGDNVGDCAGMAADLYETHCVTNIAAMILFSIFFKDNLNKDLILLPLVLTSLSIFATLIGIFFAKLKNENVIHALYTSFLTTSFCSLILVYMYTTLFFGWENEIKSTITILTGKKIFLCFATGIFLTIALVFITEYYTSYKYNPVISIAKISDKGHAPNIIQGLAVSMEATFLPVLVIIFSIIASYKICGIIGIAIAAIGMASLVGIIVALDAYGPVTDNAGGIAEMTKLDIDVRKKTDILDSVGNITKAITKGYAIGSAALGALVLFITYTEDLNFYFNNINLQFSLTDPFVIIGLFFGGMIPYLFSSLSLKAVGDVANKIVQAVRLQFLNKDVLENKVAPDYNKIVDILTQESIKKMILPSMLPLIMPIFLYTIIYLIIDKNSAFIALGSTLLGTIIIGLFLAISMTSGGGAWDNAKKYIENGNYGGKGSLAHKASITGDMVGDPYKDTAGPAINPLIKVTNIIALLLIIFISKL